MLTKQKKLKVHTGEYRSKNKTNIYLGFHYYEKVRLSLPTYGFIMISFNQF